jgi:two-component system cell cycle response regulator
MARILIIEDNPENLELMRFLLQAFSHEALVARNGEEGLSVAARERPDLILCDIHMPKLDGYGVLAQLHQDPVLRKIPCVAVTALAMLGDRSKVLDAGFNGYISKPIEPEKFVAEVEAYLKHQPGDVPPSQAATLPPQPQSQAGPVAAQVGTVLVVDDLLTNRDLIAHTLGAFGYATTLVDNVNDALEAARRAPPDLIVSDLHMPGRDGMDFLQAIKADARLSRIPFIFLSSSVWGERDTVRALDMGAQRFLQRPIEPLTLVREVQAMVPGAGKRP